MSKYLPFFIVISFVFAVACSDDSTEPTPTNTDNDNNGGDTTQVEKCDTIQSVYDNDVASILSANCAPCHVNGSSSGGVNLDGYANTKAEAEKDQFLKSIKHEAGAKNMPQGRPKLDDALIDRIECWISNGFPEN
jgi:mono/diheme cytochrome c family protein